MTLHKPKYRPLNMSISNVMRAVVEDVSIWDTDCLWFLEGRKVLDCLYDIRDKV